MMRQLLTLVFFVIFSFGLQAQQSNIIWGGPNDPNGSFENGLNDWTTVGIESAEPDSAENAIWVWDEDGNPDEGAYWSTASGDIPSQTVDNGAALFNSDFLDNGGVAGAFGDGLAPSPHRGELISPTIDCSGYNDVVVQFSQLYRNFNSTCYLEVSNDGGQTWNPINVNADVEDVTRDSIKIVNISEYAGDSSNVKIKFAFDGDYYFWMIDDVSVLSQPQNNLSATYSFYPLNNFRTPNLVNNCDTMGFSMGIENTGARDQTGVEITATILDDSGDEMFSTTESLGTYEVGREDTFDFEDIFIPDGLANGLYTIEYEVTSDSMDFNSTDNLLSEQFLVTEDVYSKDMNGHGVGFQPDPAPETWSVANFYQPCEIEDESQVMDPVFDRLMWSFSSNESVDGRIISIWIARIDQNICDNNLDDFETGQTDPFNNESLTIVGFNDYELSSNTPQSELIDSVMYDYQHLLEEAELKRGAPLVENGCYLAGVTGEDDMFLGFEQQLDYPEGFVNTVVISDQWYFAGFQGGPDATVRTEIDWITATERPTLPKGAVDMYPNPVDDRMTLEFDLQSTQDVQLQISDVMGRTVQSHQLENIVNEKWSTDFRNVQAGTYFLRVIAEDGERTIKFIKQ